jgi:DNA-binding transcriptional regulator YiaG
VTPDELKRRREALRLSQSELAEALGIHKRTVAAWEQGRQKMPPFLALALESLGRKAARK